MCDNCKRLEVLLEQAINTLNTEGKQNTKMDYGISRINKMMIQNRLKNNNIYLSELESRLTNIIEFLQKRLKD